MDITKESLVHEAALAQNLLLNYGGSAPANALLGEARRGFHGESSATTMAHDVALELTPDTFESSVRMRLVFFFIKKTQRNENDC